MKRRSIALLLFVSTLLVSCSLWSTNINTSSVSASWTWVQARHDRYVVDDSALDVSKKAVFLVQSSFVSEKLNESETLNPATIKGQVIAVTDRHDVYVEADASLSVTQRRSYLRSASLVRRVVEEDGQ